MCKNKLDVCTYSTVRFALRFVNLFVEVSRVWAMPSITTFLTPNWEYWAYRPKPMPLFWDKHFRRDRRAELRLTCSHFTRFSPIRSVRETTPQWEHRAYATISGTNVFAATHTEPLRLTCSLFTRFFLPPNEPIGYLYTKEKSPGNSKIWFVKNLEQHV